MKAQTRFKNMNSFEPAGGFSRPRWGRQILLSLLPLGVLFAAWPQNLSAQQDEQDPAQAPQRQLPVSITIILPFDGRGEESKWGFTTGGAYA